MNAIDHRDSRMSYQNRGAGDSATLRPPSKPNAPVWGRAVGPVADWIGQVLWSSARKSASYEPTFPTAGARAAT